MAITMQEEKEKRIVTQRVRSPVVPIKGIVVIPIVIAERMKMKKIMISELTVSVISVVASF